MERANQLSENEISSLQSQLDAKTASLEEAINELETKRRERCNEESEADKNQRRIEELNIEVLNCSSVCDHLDYIYTGN